MAVHADDFVPAGPRDGTVMKFNAMCGPEGAADRMWYYFL